MQNTLFNWVYLVMGFWMTFVYNPSISSCDIVDLSELHLNAFHEKKPVQNVSAAELSIIRSFQLFLPCARHLCVHLVPKYEEEQPFCNLFSSFIKDAIANTLNESSLHSEWDHFAASFVTKYMLSVVWSWLKWTGATGTDIILLTSRYPSAQF